MDSPRKLIVGYDLCDDFTQISCFSYKTMEPVPISVREGEENYMIPTVLGLRTDSKQWVFGEEAIACAAGGSGILVEHLLDRIQSENEIELCSQKFSSLALLEKYLRKTLMLVKNYFPTEQITKLVVTIRNTAPAFVDKLYEALSLLGLERDRAVVINHAGAYLYYTLNQDKTFWMNDVGLFDFNKDGLKYYQIHINRRVKPMIAALVGKDYSDTLNMEMIRRKNCDPAYLFENAANNALYKQIVTTLYFTGSGFNGTWAEGVIKNLCIGKRAFLGQNLYTKGACFAAKELAGDRTLEEFILLNDDMVTSIVYVRVYCDTTFKEIPLTKTGENWYEVDSSIEVIPDGEAELEIVIKNIMTREITRNIVKLDSFPKRPNRMTRLRIHLTCRDKSTGLITVTDLGFGEIYLESGQTMEVELKL